MAAASSGPKSPVSPNGAPALTPLGHYKGRPPIVLSRTVTPIGSRQGMRLHLTSSSVSKAHAILVNTNAGAYIHDIASRTGITVNGKKVREAELNDGDIIEIGKFTFRFNPGLPPVPVEPGRPAPTSLYDRAPRAALYIEGAEMPIAFDDRCMIIGRRSSCDIPLMEASASTTHAIIYEFNGKRYVRDLGSRNGTFVDGRKIDDQAELKLGAELKVGDTAMRYDVVGPPEDDDLEHLVGTAPLGDMLDLIAKSAPAVPASPISKKQPQPEPASEGDDSEPLPVELDEPEPVAQPVPVAKSDAIPLDRDEVDLDEEADISDANGTHALPVEKPATPKVARQANLAPDADEQVVEPMSRTGEEDETGEDNLVEMRRGWRGLSPTLPSDTDEAIESPELQTEPQSEESAAAAVGEPEVEAPELEPLSAEAPAAIPDEAATPDAVPVETDRIEISSPGFDVEPDSIDSVVEPAIETEPALQTRDEVPADVEATESEAPPEPMTVVPAPVAPVPDEIPASEDDDVADILSRAEPSPDELRLDLPSESEIDSDLAPVDLALTGEIVDDEPSELAQAIQFDEPAVIDLTPPIEDDAADVALPTIPDVSSEAPASDVSETLSVTDDEQIAASEEEDEQVAQAAPAPASDIATPALDLDSTEPASAGERVEARSDEVAEVEASAAAEALADEAPEPPTTKSRSRKKAPAEPKSKGKAKKERKPPKRKGPGVVEPEPASEPVVAREIAEPVEPVDAEADAGVEPAIAESTRIELESPADIEPIAFEPAAVDEPSKSDDVAELLGSEVLDPTEPSPESALDLDDEVVRMLSDEPGEPPVLEDTTPAELTTSELTDTTFGRAVESFVGESTGDLVEDTATEAADDVATEATPIEIEADEASVAEENTVEPVEYAERIAEAPATVDETAAVDDEVSEINVNATDAPALELDLSAEPDEDAGVPELSFDEDSALDVLNEPVDAIAEASVDVTSPDEAAPVEVSAIDESPIEESPVEESLDLDAALAEEAEEDVVTDAAADDVSEDAIQPVSTDETSEMELEEPEKEFEPETAAKVEPPKPVEPPPSAPRKLGPSNWGANQDHFLGGRPLQLGPTPPRPRRAAPFSATPVASVDHTASDDVPPMSDVADTGAQRPLGLIGVSDPGDISATIPPFRGNGPKRGQVTTGFDGLAMPPVREADVFSPASFAGGFSNQPIAQDVFGGARSQRPAPGGVTNQPVGVPSIDEPWANQTSETTDDAAARKPRPAGRATAPPGYPQASDLPNPPRRKRRWFGLKSLLILMVLSMVLTAAGVYTLTSVTSTLATAVHFDRFQDLEVGSQKQLLEKQQQTLNDPNTAELARSVLREKFPGVSAGFLDEPRQMALVANNVAWRPGPNNGSKGELVLRVSDRTPGYQALPKFAGKGMKVSAIDTDRARLYSLAYALYRANGATVESASKLQTDTAALQTEYDKSKARLDEMNAEIERQRAALGKGTSGSVADLQKQATTLESAWTDAVAKVKQLQAEIDALQKSIPVNTQPAGTAQQPVVADDDMTKMEGDLKQLEVQIAATRDQLTERATEARESLKTAMTKFDAAISDAEGAAKKDAGLQDYVTAGEQLQKQSRELTDALVQRQEETTSQLSDLKQQMVSKIEAHRADALEKDPELKDLSEQLAITNRQYNVAVSSNFKKDADDLKAKIGLIEQMIKAKQTLVGDDQFHQDQLDAIDRTIASSQKRLKEQRDTLETRLSAQQKAFAAAQPATEKLTAEEKRIVENLTSQYSAVSAARTSYNQASDALNTTGDDEALEDLKTTASAMKQRIADRRKQLTAESEKITIAKAEQERMTTIKARETDLAAAQEDAQKAEAAWNDANGKLRDAQNVVADSRQATEKLNNLLADRDRLQTDSTIKSDTLAQRTKALAKAVAPVEPKEADVVVLQNVDQRPVYAGVGMIVVALAFTGLIWLSSHRGDDDEEAMMDETDPRLLDRLGLPNDEIDPSSNGNGHHAEPADLDEVEHEADDESHLIA